MHNELMDEIADVTLKVEDQEIMAHRLVLAAASDVFKEIFSLEMRKKTTQEVIIQVNWEESLS